MLIKISQSQEAQIQIEYPLSKMGVEVFSISDSLVT